MAAKITKAHVDTAVTKLALPGFILKGVKEHKKAFDSAVSAYRRKFFFNREFKESGKASLARSGALHKEIDDAIEQIFKDYYVYSPNKIKGYKEIEKIVLDLRKKLKTLEKTLPGYSFYESAIKDKYKIEDKTIKSVPKEVITKCQYNKIMIDAAIKKYGSASIFGKTLTKGKDRFETLKETAKVHIGCIYAAEQHYDSTIGYQNLQKIADSVRTTVQGIEKDNKGKVLFAEENDLSTFMEYVNAPVSALDTEHKIPAICFVEDKGKEIADYTTGYKNFLTQALENYATKHQTIHDQKKDTRLDKNEFAVFDEAAKEAHKYLNQLEGLKKFKKELEKLAEENPRYKAAIGSSMRKLYNSKLLANIARYKDQFNTLNYTAKFGENTGYKFRNSDLLLDNYAEAIHDLIDALSNSKSSLERCLELIKSLKDQQTVILTIKKVNAQKHTLEAAKINKYTEQLTVFSQSITKEMRKWNKKYDEFQVVLARYKEETSTTKKIIQVVKILGLVAALAAGAAQISASINSSGGVDIRTTGNGRN